MLAACQANVFERNCLCLISKDRRAPMRAQWGNVALFGHTGTKTNELVDCGCWFMAGHSPVKGIYFWFRVKTSFNAGCRLIPLKKMTLLSQASLVLNPYVAFADWCGTRWLRRTCRREYAVVWIFCVSCGEMTSTRQIKIIINKNSKLYSFIQFQ